VTGRRGLLATGAALAIVGAGAAYALRADDDTRAFERYVTPSGNGAACTLEEPCGTFEAAFAAAAPGDDIRVAGGTYTGAEAELTGITPKPAGPRIVFRVVDGERAEIRGETAYKGGVARITLDGTGGRDGQGLSYSSTTTSHVDIGYGSGGTSVVDFTIRGARMGGNGPAKAGQAIWLSACRDVLLQDIEIYEIWRGDGIHVSQTAGDDACSGVVMDRIFMHDFDGIAPDDHQDALQVRAGSDIVMRNSVIVDLRLAGSQGWFANPVGDLGTGGNGCVLENTYIARVASSGGAEVNISGCDIVVRNNVIDGNIGSCDDARPACHTTVEFHDNIANIACSDIDAIEDVMVPGSYGDNVFTGTCGNGHGDVDGATWADVLENLREDDDRLSVASAALAATR
jgi:Protein of unknown function (DUF1565)